MNDLSCVMSANFFVRLAQQAKEQMGTGARFRGGHGDRVRVCGGDGVRVADAARHRDPASENDARLVFEPDDRLLPHSAARLVQRPLPIEARATETIHHSSIHRHYTR